VEFPWRQLLRTPCEPPVERKARIPAGSEPSSLSKEVGGSYATNFSTVPVLALATETVPAAAKDLSARETVILSAPSVLPNSLQRS
jgi:hypothetical protein